MNPSQALPGPDELAVLRFNAYRPPAVRNRPQLIAFGVWTLVLCSPCLLGALMTYSGGNFDVSDFLAPLGVSLGVVVLSLAAFKVKSIFHEQDAAKYSTWDSMRRIYVEALEQHIKSTKTQAIESAIYTPAPGDVVFWAGTGEMTTRRERVVSKKQTDGVLETRSALLEHSEGDGVVAITRKGVNFISSGHHGNLFIKWKDIAEVQADGAFMVIQPYSGKVRYIQIRGAGQDPTQDPLLIAHISAAARGDS